MKRSYAVAIAAVLAACGLVLNGHAQTSPAAAQNQTDEQRRLAAQQEALKVQVVPALYGDPMLAGAIDMHAHSGPDLRPRSITDMELAREARKAGMRAIVLKQHWSESADRAQLVMTEVPGIEVFGGIALNRAAGGINPAAIRAMIDMEGHRGRIVWMPTVDAANDGRPRVENYAAVDVIKNGKLVPEMAEVFKLIADNNLILATGHLTPEESVTVLAAAKQAGVRRMVVTHARTSLENMKKMVAQGAYLECIYNDITLCAGRIKAIGAEHFILGTDLGGTGRPIHTDGLKTLITRVLSEGVTQAQVDVMVRKNPARLLGLDPW